MTSDPLEVLLDFHDEHQLGYPLLRDQDARHVKAYGVLNPEYEPGHRAYGIPLPGTSANTQLFNAMLEMGMEELDNSAVIGVIETLANQPLLEG